MKFFTFAFILGHICTIINQAVFTMTSIMFQGNGHQARPCRPPWNIPSEGLIFMDALQIANIADISLDMTYSSSETGWLDEESPTSYLLFTYFLLGSWCRFHRPGAPAKTTLGCGRLGNTIRIWWADLLKNSTSRIEHQASWKRLKPAFVMCSWFFVEMFSGYSDKEMASPTQVDRWLGTCWVVYLPTGYQLQG